MTKKKLKSVFYDVLPTEEKKAAWQTFLEQSSHLQEDPYGKKVWTEYKSLVESKEFIDMMNKAAQLELTLVQLAQMVDPEIALGTIRQDRGNETVEYIIVRAPFTEDGKKRREIRVYVGRVDDARKSIAQLKKDQKFLEEARKKVIEAMREVFSETRKQSKRWL
jgi:hypothetical protein